MCVSLSILISMVDVLCSLSILIPMVDVLCSLNIFISMVDVFVFPPLLSKYQWLMCFPEVS